MATGIASKAIDVQTAVISTPELLESILLQLDQRTLLISAQRVSRGWNSLIRESPAIQKALFFEQDPTTGKCRRNPLLAALFPPWFDTPTTGRGTNMWHPDVFAGLPLAASEKKDAFLRRGASWRRMLTQQPAVTKLGYIEQEPQNRGDTFSRAMIDFPEGLRMGALYDMTWRVVCHRNPRAPCQFVFIWRPFPDHYEAESYLPTVIEGFATFGDDIGAVLYQLGTIPGFGYFARGGFCEEDIDPLYRCEEYEVVNAGFVAYAYINFNS